MRPLVEDDLVKGIAHITGGGITENLPRTLPQGCAADIDQRAWSVPPLFGFLQQRGGIATGEMFRVFNMGIGLILVCAGRDAVRVMNMLSRGGEPDAARLGSVVAGDGTVRYL